MREEALPYVVQRGRASVCMRVPLTQFAVHLIMARINKNAPPALFPFRIVPNVFRLGNTTVLTSALCFELNCSLWKRGGGGANCVTYIRKRSGRRGFASHWYCLLTAHWGCMPWLMTQPVLAN